MTATIEPDLSVLQPPQRRLWNELVDVPEHFVLYGGTAIALRLGHRTSVDFDFFGSTLLDPDELYPSLPLLKGSRVIQKAPNTLTCLIERGGPVQVSFFGVPDLPRLNPPARASDNRLHIADLLDLAGTKVAVVQRRAEAKDYLDIDAILRLSDIDLPVALVAGRRLYGSAFSPLSAMKALSYFEDGDLASLDDAVKERLGAAVASVDTEDLPEE